MSTLRWSEEQLAAHKARYAGKSEAQIMGEVLNTVFPPRKEKPKRTGPSELEVRFWQQWSQTGLPMPEREWYFLSDRGFRFDFAWPAPLKLAIEVQGMAHRIKERFNADIEKKALAQIAGWTVLEVNGDSIRNGRALVWAETLYRERAGL